MGRAGGTDVGAGGHDAAGADGPDAPVAIVGAGPVGLALALGLARRGVRSVLLERADGPSRHSKAPAVHVRTRQVLREWGADDDVTAAGQVLRRVRLHDADHADHADRADVADGAVGDPGARGTGRALLELDLGVLDDEARDPGLLVLVQSRTEELLLEHVRATGRCDVRHGTELRGLRVADDGVVLEVTGPRGEEEVRARYVVGCDGARSVVREALGLGLTGSTYPLAPLLVDVRVEDARDRLPSPRLHQDGRGVTGAVRLEPGLWRVVRIDRHVGGRADDVTRDDGDDISDADARRHVVEALGPGPVDVTWSSRFRVHRRSAARMRTGPVLLAGDAAHLHSPAGGQGMNAGIHDAHALAWRLAACLGGADEDLLLDSYDTERRALVAGDVTRFTDLLTRAVLLPSPAVRRLAITLVARAVRHRRVARRAARRLAMLDLGYRDGPLVGPGRGAGRLLPDARLDGARAGPDPGRPVGHRAHAPVRLHDVLAGRWALLHLDDGTARPEGLARRDDAPDLPGLLVVTVDARRATATTRTLGCVLGRAPVWALVRPDAHVVGTWRDRAGALAAAARLRGAFVSSARPALRTARRRPAAAPP